VTVAYVDTSTIIAVAFGEPGSRELEVRLDGLRYLVSSNLLEAEVRATFARERMELPPGLLTGIDWVLPDRSLTPEIRAVLVAGRLKGADLWHVATALYASIAPEETHFLTEDRRQGEVARSLGFRVCSERQVLGGTSPPRR